MEIILYSVLLHLCVTEMQFEDMHAVPTSGA